MKTPSRPHFPASVLFAAFLTALFAGGCATSKAFQQGAAFAGPGLADAAARYVNADASLTTLQKSSRLVQTGELRDATAEADKVERGRVTTAWDAVRPWYATYVDADPALSDREKLLRARVMAEMDRLIANDASRPLAGLGAAPVPPKPPAPVVTPAIPAPAPAPDAPDLLSPPK